MGKEEGIIKFNCEWEKTPAFSGSMINELIDYRNRLFKMGLIGCYQDGIGYGNISCREQGNAFFISGSGTGDVAGFSAEHISLVTNFDIQNNKLKCRGPVKASSESLSHAVIYETLPQVSAVIHIHNAALWHYNFNQLPTTNPSVPYGTPAMALEIKKYLMNDRSVIIMGGHEEGIITYGPSLEIAFSLIEGIMEKKNTANI